MVAAGAEGDAGIGELQPLQAAAPERSQISTKGHCPTVAGIYAAA